MVPDTKKGFIGVQKVIFDHCRRFFHIFEHQGVHLDKNGIYQTVAKGSIQQNKKVQNFGFWPNLRDPPPPMQTLAKNQIFFTHLKLVYNNITRITMSSGLNVLSTLVLNSWCGQSSKGPRGQTSLGVCWVNSQAKVEQVSSNFDCDCGLKHIHWLPPVDHHLDISKYGFGFQRSDPDPPPVWKKPKFCTFFFNASLRLSCESI